MTGASTKVHRAPLPWPMCPRITILCLSFLFRDDAFLQVLTTASTLALQTFDCDDAVGDGRSYLRADYSLSCGSKLHIFFKVYAVLMILVRGLRLLWRGHPVFRCRPIERLA